jgi:phospholipid/cholesterol/gamma-HCH transport system substrate-binding protein
VHDLVNSASAALDGNAVPIKDTMDQLTRAAGGLADDSGNLFTTIRNLNDFVGALNHSGEKVRQFSNELASISALLDQNRHELATLLSTADGTLGRVTSFARDNKDRLGEAVSGLTDAAQQLSDNQINVANVLHLAPTTLANFYNIYNPTDATFTGRAMIAQVNGLANTACQAMFSLGGTLRDCQSALAPLLDQFNMENAPITLNPVEQAGTPNQQGPGAAHTTTPGAPGQVPVNRSPLIPLLGGPTG